MITPLMANWKKIFVCVCLFSTFCLPLKIRPEHPADGGQRQRQKRYSSNARNSSNFPPPTSLFLPSDVFLTLFFFIKFFSRWILTQRFWSICTLHLCGKTPLKKVFISTPTISMIWYKACLDKINLLFVHMHTFPFDIYTFRCFRQFIFFFSPQAAIFRSLWYSVVFCPKPHQFFVLSPLEADDDNGWLWSLWWTF